MREDSRKSTSKLLDSFPGSTNMANQARPRSVIGVLAVNRIYNSILEFACPEKWGWQTTQASTNFVARPSNNAAFLPLQM